MKYLAIFLLFSACFSSLPPRYGDEDGSTLSTPADGGGALPPGDGPSGPVSSGPCDPVSQIGCAQGQTCTVVKGVLTCAEAGNKQVGALCSADSSECTPGATCIDVSSTTPLCHAMCKSDAECKATFGEEQSRCVPFSDLPVHLCSLPCNPIPIAGPSGCPAELSCLYITVPSVGTLTDCVTLGTGEDGASCPTGPLDCAAGFTCNSANHRCRKLCRPDFVTDCDGQCITADGARYGLCIPPS